MHLYSFVLSILLARSAVAGVTTFKVNVGKGGLVFEPNDLAGVEPGSFVEFAFFPKNHTVTQSSFAQPCIPFASNLDAYNDPQEIIHSGFVPTPAPGPNNQTFTIRIENDKPIWLYCAQTTGNHCQQGMVMSINAPREGERTFAKYLALAKGAQVPSRVPEGGVQGGTLNVSNPNVEGETKTYTTTTIVSTIATSTFSDTSSTWTKEYPTVVQTVTVVVTTGVSASSTIGGSGVETTSVQSGTGSATQAVPAPTGGANELGGGKERVWWLVVAIGASVGALGIL